MALLTYTDTKIAAAKIDDFSAAWNDKDLGLLAQYISADVIYNNPPINLGFFRMKGKKVSGRFYVLKFWKKFFDGFETIHEEKEILRIKYDVANYIVTCNIHNYNFGVSIKSIFCLNNDLLINKIEFMNITDLKKDKELSALALLLKQLKKKILN